MALAPAQEAKVASWLHRQALYPVLTAAVITAESPGYRLFYSLVFGRYTPPWFDPAENYQTSRQFGIHNKQVLLEMNLHYEGDFDAMYQHSIGRSDALIFVYHVSDRQHFLELPSAYKKAGHVKGFPPQTVVQRFGQDALKPSLPRRILGWLQSMRGRGEPLPPSPVMVLAVSDMASKPTPPQVTSEEGENFSTSIGAIFVEVPCSTYYGSAYPEVKDKALLELAKRVILQRAYAEELARKAR